MTDYSLPELMLNCLVTNRNGKSIKYSLMPVVETQSYDMGVATTTARDMVKVRVPLLQFTL